MKGKSVLDVYFGRKDSLVSENKFSRKIHRSIGKK